MLINFVNLYQNLPLEISPIAFKVGFFAVTWYSLMYLVAFGTVYGLLKWRRKNDQVKVNLNNFFQNLETFFLYLIGGLLIGARLGYVLFYNFDYFWQNPIAIISPFDVMGEFVGIYGLSYHGGLLGIILATTIFVKKYKLNFWQLADFVTPAVPAGYFFGRLGNFLNGELYGRITEKEWGMYFRDENGLVFLRHPSQLYEAFFEGLILFLILWMLRNGFRYRGKVFSIPCFLLYVLGYGLFRFFIEFFREPDVQLGLFLGFLTLGQIFSLGMILAAAGLFWYKKCRGEKVDKIC